MLIPTSGQDTASANSSKSSCGQATQNGKERRRECQKALQNRAKALAFRLQTVTLSGGVAFDSDSFAVAVAFWQSGQAIVWIRFLCFVSFWKKK